MRKSHNILMLIAVVVTLTVLTGCTYDSKVSASELRWQHTMEQARLDAARQSLAQGQFEYAKKVLEPCINSPKTGQDAEKLFMEIQAAQQVYAQLTASRSNAVN